MTIATATWMPRDCVSRNMSEKLATMLAVMTHFVEREIAPEVCQLVISFPNRGCVVSHLSIAGEEREKQAAASARKTMPGIKGTTSATMPTARLMHPRTM